MLLSAAVLGSLLITAPAASAASSAAPQGPRVSVAKVKAVPARATRACPTTVGFSAVVAVSKKGVVRYRWVRSDGTRSAIRTLRAKRAGKVTVRDRQTFDRSASGWQAVQVIGRKGLSAKARFNVTCKGPAREWTVGDVLPAAPGKPLIAVAALEARPAMYRGSCPTTVTFSGTIQVSRTPATVRYQWIDSATGESAPRTLTFAAGGPRSKQIGLHLGVGSSVRGWKAIRVLDAGGQDSGRATYSVTCERRPAPSPTGRPTTSPRPTPTATTPTSPAPTSPAPTTPAPTPTAEPTSTPTSTSTPTPGKPVARIVSVTPGTYEGSCVEPLDYRATGQITLPAGPAQRVTYWWQLNGTAWQEQVADFPASDQPRSLTVDAAWTVDPAVNGGHTLNLMVRDGETAAHQFSITCTPEPDSADLTIRSMMISVFRGDCARATPVIRTSATLATDREAEVRYRFVVDGEPTAVRTLQVRPGTPGGVSHSFSKPATTSGGGTILLEVLNHDMPVMEIPYSWTCEPIQTSGTVIISELSPVAFYGDCTTAPYVTAFAALHAANDTEVQYRWVRDGVPADPMTATVRAGGMVQIQSAYWTRAEATDGTIKLEVLNHDKPSAQATYRIVCN